MDRWGKFNQAPRIRTTERRPAWFPAKPGSNVESHLQTQYSTSDPAIYNIGSTLSQARVNSEHCEAVKEVTQDYIVIRSGGYVRITLTNSVFEQKAHQAYRLSQGNLSRSTERINRFHVLSGGKFELEMGARVLPNAARGAYGPRQDQLFF